MGHGACALLRVQTVAGPFQSSRAPLTCRLLHVHHEGLQGVESLELFGLVAQVLQQQASPLADLLPVHLVEVVALRSSITNNDKRVVPTASRRVKASDLDGDTHK